MAKKFWSLLGLFAAFLVVLTNLQVIVPVAVIDSYKAFDIHSIKKMTAQIHYLEPLTYEQYKGMKTVEIAAIVKSRIEAEIERYAPEKRENGVN